MAATSRGVQCSATNGGPSGSACPGRKVNTAPESEITYATSGSLKRVLTGTTMGPANGYAAAGTNALCPQATGHARGAVPKLTIGDALAAQFDNSFALRRLLHGGPEHLDQRGRAAVVARDAVARARDAAVVERLNHQYAPCLSNIRRGFSTSIVWICSSVTPRARKAGSTSLWMCR